MEFDYLVNMELRFPGSTSAKQERDKYKLTQTYGQFTRRNKKQGGE